MNKARPLAQSLLDHALTAGKAYGITDAEIVVTASRKEENKVEKGNVTESLSGSSVLVHITLYADGHVLYFSKNTLDAQELRAAMTENMRVIHLTPENKDNRPLEKEKVYKGPLADFDLYDTAPPPQDDLIAYAKAVEAAAMAEPGVKTIRAAGASQSRYHYLKLSTNGLVFENHSTAFQGGASVIAEDGNGMQIGGEYSTARHFSDMTPAKPLGQKAGRNAVAKLSPILPQTGEMTIVLDNSAAASFFGAVYSAIDGDRVFRGTTFLKDKIGQQVMSKEVTLEDDPRIPRGHGSKHIDVAGSEAKKMTFIENGVLKSYHVTLNEARQLGIAPMGREHGSTNSRILPGSLTPDALIADIKEGLYIQGFSGGTVDVNSGQHSRQAHGLLIKDGKITDTAVAGFVVSGNLRDMFMSVALANDTPALPSTKHSLAAPTTRINKVTIAGR